MSKPDDKIGISRDDAWTLLNQFMKNKKLVSHCLASEAIMRSLAHQFGEDEELWGLSGLLHDLDFEIVNEDPGLHGAKAAEILEEKGVCSEMVNAIKKHNAEGLGLERSTLFEYALTCGKHYRTYCCHSPGLS